MVFPRHYPPFILCILIVALPHSLLYGYYYLSSSLFLFIFLPIDNDHSLLVPHILEEGIYSSSIQKNEYLQAYATVF